MERISVFDIFKIGIGPSSSHTMGPWRAAQRFVNELMENQLLEKVVSIRVDLYGPLAKTGLGHGTDIAVLLGLSGYDPVSIPETSIQEIIKTIRQSNYIKPGGQRSIPFNPAQDLIFNVKENLPFHPNGMRCTAAIEDGKNYSAEYFSIGGGFVIKEAESGDLSDIQLPYPIQVSADLEAYCRNSALQIDEVVWQNELKWKSAEEIKQGLLGIYRVMLDCAYQGCHTEGFLPGGLQVTRRAATISKKLISPGLEYHNPEEWVKAIRSSRHDFESINKWISCFALAVNEVNASFGRVVTAPTNGAAGVIPAVLLYHLCFGPEKKEEDIIRFLLTAGELGSIFKKGATISAAMGGCQAEIGVSSAMAAGALTLCIGGDYKQVLMAAEIAMEHHLGLTCDPIGGLVQIPCIERNTMGAIKAITAAHIAMESNPDQAKVSLDAVIKTMWETALDMNDKYKETAEGGLAMNISVNVPEC
ncbi:MAG: L-serine ammonia-lyase [Saprospiraceae bacterium]|nr:L-serine ammonia-lyase [Saprospiraceae bacterium]